ncbi:MAG: hypothetical protein ACLSFC_16045 [Enterocloster bolteae]
MTRNEYETKRKVLINEAEALINEEAGGCKREDGRRHKAGPGF